MDWIRKLGLHASVRSPEKSGHCHLFGPYSALNMSLPYVFSFIFLHCFLTRVLTFKVHFTLIDFSPQFPEGEALYYMNIMLFEFRDGKRKEKCDIFGGVLRDNIKSCEVNSL